MSTSHLYGIVRLYSVPGAKVKLYVGLCSCGEYISKPKIEPSKVEYDVRQHVQAKRADKKIPTSFFMRREY